MAEGLLLTSQFFLQSLEKHGVRRRRDRRAPQLCTRWIPDEFLSGIIAHELFSAFFGVVIVKERSFLLYFFFTLKLLVSFVVSGRSCTEKQLYDYLQGNHTELLRRSLLGQVRVYNNLEQHTVNAGSVKLFQRRVQLHLKDKARRKDAGWKASLTARLR